MSIIIANISFTYGTTSFQHMKSYDTSVNWVAAANTAHPELFFASGGTRICTSAFVFKDSRAGGFERIIHTGDTLPTGDPAVIGAPSCFTS